MSALGQRFETRNSMINFAILEVGTFERAIDPRDENISSTRS